MAEEIPLSVGRLFRERGLVLESTAEEACWYEWGSARSFGSEREILVPTRWLLKCFFRDKT